MYLSVPMQRELSLNFHRNNVYGHLEQVCKTNWVKWKWKKTHLLEICPKCPYTLFLWKINDSSRSIETERYNCTTICKHTLSSGIFVLKQSYCKYRKRLLLRCIHHFKSELINNIGHVRISGTEPSLDCLLALHLLELFIWGREWKSNIQIGGWS